MMKWKLNGININMKYIITYNPSSDYNSQRLKEKLESRFPTGAIIKKDVYIIRLDSEDDVMRLKETVDEIYKIGESVFIAKLGNSASSKGYPKSLKEWMESR